MTKPSNNVAWGEDVFNALDTAKKRSGVGVMLNPQEVLESLFSAAPRLAAERRGITDEELILEMEIYAFEGIEHDFELNPEGQRHWVFQFVMAYMSAHVEAELVGELEIDRIMDYLCEHYELFDT